MPGAVKGALLSSSTRHSQRTSPPTSRTRSTSCRTSRWSPARSSCMRRATGGLLPGGRRLRQRIDGVQPLEPEGRPALGRRSPTGRCFANVSRSAEVPSFGESTSFPAACGSLHRHQGADAPPPIEIGTRGRRPDYTWDLAVYRAEIDNELHVPLQRLRQLQRHRTPTRRCIRDWRSASASPCCKSMLRRRSGAGSAVAQRRLHAQRLPLRQRSRRSATTSCRARRATSCGPSCSTSIRAASTSARTSNGCRRPTIVDSANTLKTEAYAHLGLAKLGFDNGGPFSAYIEGRNLVRRGLHRQRQHHRRRQRRARPLFEPGTGRAVFAGVKYRW